eukprot:6517539-Alexandrium_andersonii.AAC.1
MHSSMSLAMRSELGLQPPLRWIVTMVFFTAHALPQNGERGGGSFGSATPSRTNKFQGLLLLLWRCGAGDAVGAFDAESVVGAVGVAAVVGA